MGYFLSFNFFMAGLPALQGGETGQVRKEAATATYCKCRGLGSPPHFRAQQGVAKLLRGHDALSKTV